MPTYSGRFKSDWYKHKFGAKTKDIDISAAGSEYNTRIAQPLYTYGATRVEAMHQEIERATWASEYRVIYDYEYDMSEENYMKYTAAARSWEATKAGSELFTNPWIVGAIIIMIIVLLFIFLLK